MGHVVSDIGHAVSSGVSAVGNGLSDVGHAVSSGVSDVGHAVSSGVSDVGHFVSNVVSNPKALLGIAGALVAPELSGFFLPMVGGSALAAGALTGATIGGVEGGINGGNLCDYLKSVGVGALGGGLGAGLSSTSLAPAVKGALSGATMGAANTAVHGGNSNDYLASIVSGGLGGAGSGLGGQYGGAAGAKAGGYLGSMLGQNLVGQQPQMAQAPTVLDVPSGGYVGNQPLNPIAQIAPTNLGDPNAGMLVNQGGAAPTGDGMRKQQAIYTPAPTSPIPMVGMADGGAVKRFTDGGVAPPTPRTTFMSNTPSMGFACGAGCIGGPDPFAGIPAGAVLGAKPAPPTPRTTFMSNTPSMGFACGAGCIGGPDPFAGIPAGAVLGAKPVVPKSSWGGVEHFAPPAAPLSFSMSDVTPSVNPGGPSLFKADGGAVTGIGGLAHGGLPSRHHPDAPEGHHPEFVTGETGFYAKGKGTGQSDDIPAMLHPGDYVMDADTVSAFGDGSSKAGAERLEQFRRSLPVRQATGGPALPAKIADGEYVLPGTFVTRLGGGSNKKGAELLDKMREELRAHKRSAPDDKIPPKAKPPAEYLRKARG